ncbi:MAG TPA: NYN domain-containing protein [Candidatus Paceibacterota bacterium]
MNNYAFIDSNNVYLSIRSQGWSIEWERFRVYLREHYRVAIAYLFIGYIEGNNDVYVRLQKAGFICIWKPVLTYKDGTVKGNVDAELVLHTMIQLPNFDKAVIVTGDGDFYCLVQYLLEQNKLQTVLVPNQHKYSALLKKFAKKNIAFMNDLKNKIGLK